MSSKIEEQLQLYLKFLGPNVVTLRNTRTSDNSKNSVKIDHVGQL
jgi:hypothetical protein